MASPFLCIGTTPALQRVMQFRSLAPGEVNRAARTFDGVAGKSVNVAKVLTALGERAVATGFLGGARGAELRRLLEARGIECEFIEVTPSTRQCVTVIDEATGAVTELVEESQPVEPGAYAALLEAIERRLRGARAAILSGTIASGGPADLYATCVRLAKAAGALAVVDASGAALEQALKAQPDVVKPNRKELEVTVGRAVAGEADLQRAMRELHERGAGSVVVTAGSQPTYALDGARGWRIAAPCVAALNPIGSGDSFTAALAWRLGRGDDLGEACRWGTAAGAANALTFEAGTVERAEVERLASLVEIESI